MTLKLHLRLTFAAIVAVAAAIAAASYTQYRRLEGDARTINLAGSQRMRAYRIASLASQHALNADLWSREQVEDELARAERLLAGLLEGEAELGLAATPPGKARVALELAASRRAVFDAEVRRLLDQVAAGEPTDRELRVQAIVALAGGLAAAMDTATGELERASAAAVRRSRDLQLALFGLVGLVALLFLRVVRRALVGELPAVREGLAELAEGRLGATLPEPTGHDEVAELTAAFNRTSRELERAHRVIVEHEAELGRRNAELERLDDLKSQFLSTVSHELRTPLTSVIGFADLLERGTYGELQPPQRERVVGILRNARHLLRLIEDILDLSRIEAGRFELRLETFEVGPLIEEVIEGTRPRAHAKKLSLAADIAKDVPAIVNDSARVRQILFNLVTNAVKFTDRGGVAVRVARIPEDDAVRIAVEDTGIGIPSAQRHRLFRRFSQLDMDATRKQGGAGLGLHISARIAAAIGARLEVSSEAGRGSEFALVLPVRSAAGEPAQVQDRSEAPLEEVVRWIPRTDVPVSSSPTTNPTS